MAGRDRETYNKGLSAITGQTTPIPMTEWAMDAPHVVEALIRASAASDRHMLLGPTYQYAGARKSPLPGGDLYGTADHETPDDQLLKSEWEALHFLELVPEWHSLQPPLSLAGHPQCGAGSLLALFRRR